MTESNPLKVRGRAVRRDERGYVCVTDIHQAAGFTKNQRPTDYIRLPTVMKMVTELHHQLVGKSHQFKMSNVWSSKSGPDGGTFAHPVLALAYAEYLSPKLAIEVREVFLRFKAADPVLADEILDRASPEANEWAARRAMGRVVRNEYTRELDQRGVTGWQFGTCTNETYKGLFDQTAKQLKSARSLPEKANLRDKMSMKELAFVAASEALAIERMQDEMAADFTGCRRATAKASGAIRAAIDADRSDRKPRML